MEYTTNKIKTDIFVIQFDMSDENFYMEDVFRFAEKCYEKLPEKSAIILLPNYMTIEPMDKEAFRMLLNKAEEFYKTL